MASMKLTRHIQAPPEKVFSVASDFARAPEVVRGIQKVEMLTQGPVGVGTKFRETRKMFGKEASEEMEVTAFEPHSRYCVDAESHGCKYHSEFSFVPMNGGTEVSMTFEAQPVSTMAKIMSFMMKPMIKSVSKACAQDLDDIKAAIENRSV